MALTSVSFRETFSSNLLKTTGTGAIIGCITTVVLLILGRTFHWSMAACQACNPILGAAYGAIGGVLINFIFTYLKDKNFQGKIVHIPKTNQHEGEL